MPSQTSMMNKREYVDMWQGKRRLIKPVDDWSCVDFDDSTFNEVLKPFVYVRGDALPRQELYVSSAHAYGVEIKNGDMIWVLKNNATDVMTELEKFGCEFKVTDSIEDDSLIGLFITKVPDEVTEND